MKYVKIIIETKTRNTDMMYTYLAPDTVKVGDFAYVPFGNANKLRRGLIIEILDDSDLDKRKVKTVDHVDEIVSLSEEMITTCMWMRQRYGIKYYDAISCFMPKGNLPPKPSKLRPIDAFKGEFENGHELTSEQKSVCNEIGQSIRKNQQSNFLIHGITGSGKTKIYIQMTQAALDMSKKVIMLVPEISLTKQVIDRYVGKFGKDKIAILHSKLTPKQRFEEWQRIRTGKVDIVIGARMAVFAPLDNIGLIIMDEEHESTYKSDMSPKYETVDIALKRLLYHKGVMILGSATPSVTSYYRTKQGIYKLLELKNRYNGVATPHIKIVDMREKLMEGDADFISSDLFEAMQKTLQDGKQIILFLNRRGYSTVIKCKHCGEVMKCPTCAITLTYHKKGNKASCHYCGKSFRLDRKCGSCGSENIIFKGVGTQQVEEKIEALFPEYHVQRLDLDTAKSLKTINKVIEDFSSRKIDILIGTQLVAKGLDFKNVDLVGVISADTTLNIPDYRSSERTYQMITQVAGRAGRGDEVGSVIVQTYSPDSLAIKAAANNDYRGFYASEIVYRQMMNYPPFTDIIKIDTMGSDINETLDECKKIYSYVEKLKISNGEDEIYLPRVEEVKGEKRNDSFKAYILIKSAKGNRNKYLYYVSSYIQSMVKSKCKCAIIIDVNPYGSF